MNSNTFIIRPCAAATCARRLPVRRNMCNSACALRERRRRAGRPALLCYLLLPIVRLGSRAAVRGLSPQVRGGRCHSSAARAKCRLHNGFHSPSACAARKHDRDAIRRLVLTPHASLMQAYHRVPDRAFRGFRAPQGAMGLLERVYAPGGDFYLIEIVYGFAAMFPRAYSPIYRSIHGLSPEHTALAIRLRANRRHNFDPGLFLTPSLPGKYRPF